MNMERETTTSGKIIYVPYDDNNEVIMPIFEYLKHMAINGYSQHTLRSNCQHLLTFWRYLQNKNMNYIEFIGKVDEGKKKAYENLSAYQLYLLFPDIGSNVIPIDGRKQAREESTVNQMMSSVVSFYNFMANTGKIANVPYVTQKAAVMHSNSFLREMYINKRMQKKSLFSMKAKEKMPEYITLEEFNRCWEACRTRVSRVIIGLMFFGGLRVSEVVGLHISDMKDIPNKIIHVVKRNDIDNPDAAVKYNSEGDVIINDKLKEEIIDYMTEDLLGIDTDYLIINFKGKNKHSRMRTDNIRDLLNTIAKRAGIERLTPHMLRHGCAMNMLKGGADLLSISKQLRHKNVSTTQTYAKMDISGLIEAHKKLAEARGESFKTHGMDIDEIVNELLREEDEE